MPDNLDSHLKTIGKLYRRCKPPKGHVPLNAIEAGLLNVDFKPTSTPEPCDAMPGTRGRMKAYVDRLERGEELYHADDRTVTDAALDDPNTKGNE